MPVVIDYFYEAGCADCYRVNNQIMPDLKERFEGFYILNNYDVGERTNVLRLIAYQHKLNVVSNEPVMMVVDYRYVLNGFDGIKKGLLERVNECMSERMTPGWIAPESIEMPENDQNGAGLAESRLKVFTWSAVAFGGFTDGINPCAIGTLVFFMSLLTVTGVKRKRAILMGVTFCVASFLTYTAIGYGLLKVIYRISGFAEIRIVFEYGLIGVLLVLSCLSFRDACRYKKSGKTEDVTLQLPDRVKKLIHNILKRGVRSRSLFIGGLTAGILVTLLESVCTGQVYVPTLVLVSQSDSALSGKALAYLFLYNAMFIIPLVAVFILAMLGLRTERLITWSRSNVVPSKTFLGLFFLFLALLMWWL